MVFWYAVKDIDEELFSYFKLASIFFDFSGFKSGLPNAALSNV